MAADAAGGLIVNAAPAPGNPVSPIGNNLVPNNPVNRWNFVPVPGGQFLFVFFSPSYYHTLSGSMAFRIHDPATGQLWGVPNLAAGNQVMLGAGNTLWSI